MSNILCITTFNKKLYDTYAFGLMKSFKNLLPFNLVVYSEDNMSFLKSKHDYEFEVRDSFKCIPELKEFINRNKERNKKDKKRKGGKGYKFDAIRFCYKVFCVTHCGLNIDKKYDYLIWLDSDILIKEKFKLDNKFIRENTLMSYLGRKNLYSECGFLIFNLRHSHINKYFTKCKKMYTTNNIYNLKEWHDCECFDEVRRQFEKKYNVKTFDMSNKISGAARRDVFKNTFLNKYMLHFKGNWKFENLAENKQKANIKKHLNIK